MKMQIDPNIIFRVPQFSYKMVLADKWEELKQSILQSSLEFYQLIKDVKAEEIDTLPPNVLHTVWKYFNRASYRSTPFGSFASVGYTKLGKDDSFVIEEEQTLHQYPCWTTFPKPELSIAELLDKNVQIMANTSHYQIGEDIRYVGKFDENYELADITLDDIGHAILANSTSPIAINELLTLLSAKHDSVKVIDLLEVMICEQLLISELQPNLIGEDYFERTKASPTNTDKYIIAERKSTAGHLDGTVLRHLPAMIQHLHELLPSYASPELEQFTEKFLAKFGEREIPIMVALDPELGVGYGNMENSAANDPFLAELEKSSLHDDAIENTIAYLLPQLIKAGCKAIDAEQLKRPKKLVNEPLPNTIPVLCRAAGDYLELGHVGGCTSNALLGRFTVAIPEIDKQAKQVAQLEQESNPNVVFFDIDYSVGTEVDNVNRRKKIYEHNLSILTYNTQADLQLDDLYVSVRGKSLVLRSKKIDKQLVPRMASAYNYTLSNLSVFRLLCDLQHQGIHKNLYLRLRDRFPNLEYYPSVYFRNIILSPQTWLLHWHELKTVAKQPDATILKRYLAEKQVTPFFQIAVGDKALIFNSDHEDDLVALLYQLEKKGKVYVEERKMQCQKRCADTKGQPYEAEYLLNLYHREELYRGLPSANEFSYLPSQTFLPGSNWLYFEIYCHPHRADELLLQTIHPFVESQRQNLFKWFFIRYTQGGHHLRFRIMLKQAALVGAAITSFTELIQPLINSGVVADLKLCTYKRETERYGKVNLPMVENQFTLDSDHVIALLHIGLSTNEKYGHCMQLISDIGEEPFACPNGLKAFAKQQAEAFAAEHKFGPAQFKQLNQKFREINRQPLPINCLEPYHALKEHAVKTLLHYPNQKRSEILGAFIHMHINRLFHTSQRTHEAVVYYMLYKKLQIPKPMVEV